MPCILPYNEYMDGKSAYLIVDRENSLGQSLGERLLQHVTVVLVTKTYAGGDLLFVPFSSSLPQIPDSLYKAIIFVWGKGEQHLLEPLLKKAQEQGAAFFLVVRDEMQEGIKELPTFVTTCILGDTFGGREETPLNQFLSHAKQTRRISLANMGLHTWRPIFFQEAIKKLAEIVSSPKEVGKTLFLGPSHQLTALSIAHGLQKVDPELSIDFSKEHEVFPERVSHTRHSVLVDYNPLVDLQKFYQGLLMRKTREVKQVAQVVFSPKRKEKSKKISWIFYLFYLAIVCVLMPILVAFASGGLGIFFLSSGVEDLRKGDVRDAVQKEEAAGKSFVFAQDAFSVVLQEAKLINMGDVISMLKEQAGVEQKLSAVIANGARVSFDVANILQGKTLTPQADSVRVVGSANNMIALLQEIEPREIPVQYQPLFLSLRQITDLGSGMVSELPSLLGVTGNKTYVVLLQNNMELRPGGGFIGSYALIRLQRGSIKEITIHDVYDADGQLKGHVEPPFAIRRYVPLVHLYLRDSNFDPDFTNNAKIAAQLLFEETGEKVDGVIGIDLTALRDFLQATGSVYVPSYNETVTDKNFFQLIESHAEKNFFPGSTQKKDFLRAFAQALMQQQKPADAKILLENAVRALLGKHVLVGLSDSFLQKPFTINNLSGTIPDEVLLPGALQDILGIVEANLGVNKVNAFVSRSISHQVAVDEKGNLQEKVTLTLTNGSDGSWPGGAYRNYIRFLLPKNAVLSRVLLNSVEQRIVPAVTNPAVYEAKTFVPPNGLEVNKETESNHTIYGFLVTVPTKSTMDVTIAYSVPHAFALSDQKQTYALTLWRQPGIEDFPYQLSITIPQAFGFVDGTIPVNKNDVQVFFSQTIPKDTSLSVSFAKK